MTTKLLVSGDVRGEVAQLFDRVGPLHASKGPFDCLLCIGDFFGAAPPDETLKRFRSGELVPPLRTYILGPAPAGVSAAGSDGVVELSTDLFCLTGAGIVTLHALRIAFASGRAAPAASADAAEAAADVDVAGSLTDAVTELRSRAAEPGFAGCDLLLTHEWPRGFFRQLPEVNGLPADLLPDRDLPTVGSELVAEIAASVRPRYHFCATEDAFFARAPYRAVTHHPAPNMPPPRCTVARLIALAGVGPDKKKKYLHALSLVSCASMSAEQLAADPGNTTDSPYPYLPPPPPPPPPSAGGGGGGVARPKVCIDWQRGKCTRGTTCKFPHEGESGCNPAAGGGGGGKRKRPEYASDARSWVHDSCWFCLASAQFESHFVVSVGEEAYVAMAKGPLLPMHALILPIAHIPCSLDLSEAAAAEIDKYVGALRKCFEARGASLLLFERYMGSGSFEHMHIQALPIPSQLAGSARAAFEAHGQRLGIRFEVLPPGERYADRLADNPEPFFAATLPSGETLLHRLSTNQRRHPLHFGRESVARMLGNPRLADWKTCLPQPAPGERASTQELEQRMADDFKQAFESFSPVE